LPVAPALARGEGPLLAQRRRFERAASSFRSVKRLRIVQGNAAEGVRWFEIYLSEEPGGARRAGARTHHGFA
jgi:hypothetical protein